MKPFFSTLALSLMLALPFTAKAATSVQLQDPESTVWDAGLDLRLRWAGSDNFPNTSHGEAHSNDYFRIRTRLWGKVTTERIDGYLRITNEFRHYRSPHTEKGRQRFPDVTLIDNLYLTFKDVGDLVDVKIGRQDLKFGKGRIISEGTPCDGSRTTYFDAVRLTFKFHEKRTLDAFALYIAREDWMPTLGRRHDARSKNKKSYHEDITSYNQNEYGAGLYYQDRSVAEFGWDLYYVFKGEEGSKSTVLGEEDPYHTHTVGTRLLPRFTETLSGEVELALQAGDDQLFAGMAYSGITYAPKHQLKPTFTLAALYLSGDRGAGRGKHAWHSVFNRDTALGDMVGAMYNKYDHTNLLYPHLSIGLVPTEGHSLLMTTGPLFAPVEESDPAGGNYGHFRGYHFRTYYIINIGKFLAEDTIFEDIQFRMLGELMTKGDYYREGQDNIGYYAEVQLTCAF
jgi:hypothetical protein